MRIWHHYQKDAIHHQDRENARKKHYGKSLSIFKHAPNAVLLNCRTECVQNAASISDSRCSLMKKLNDPRHLRRIQIVQSLFSESFRPEEHSLDSVITKVYLVKKEIDSLIEESAPQFPIEKIAKIDVAILRLAIFELLFDKKEPEKVIIDEAVELGKGFGGEGSPSFINGVLGNLLKKNEIKKE